MQCGKVPLIAVWTTALALSASGIAEEKDNVVAMDDVVVTSSTTASETIKKPPYAPASVTVITREDLMSRDVVSLSDAISNVEGINVVGGRKSGSLSIRGMASDATLILVDGRRLNTGFSDKANGMGEALEGNHIPPVDAIARIEIIRGPMSAVYGSDAMGGVINIITRKPAAKWTGSVGTAFTKPQDAKAGSTYQGDFYVSGPLVRDRLNLKVWGFEKFHEEDAFANGFSQSERRNISLSLNFTPNKQNDFFARLTHIDQNMKSKAGNSSDVSQSVDYDFDEQTVGHRGAYDGFSTDIELYRKNTTRDGSNEPWHPETENYVADGKVTVPLASHNLTAGAQWKEDRTRTDAGYKALDNTFGRESELSEYAVFAEDEWALTRRFTATAGLRYLDNEYYGSHSTLRGYGVLMLNDAWTVKGGYAGGYKNPDLRETDPNIGNPQSWKTPVAYTWGNPDLKPQESDNYEAGLYYEPLGSFAFNATVFATEYKNKIINTGRTQFYDTEGELIRGPEGKIWGTYLNIGEASVRGLELAARYLPFPSLRLRGNYTYTDSDMDASGAVVTAANGDTLVDWRFLDGKPLVGTPKNKIDLSGEWRATAKFSIHAAGHWHDAESNVDWSKTVARESDYKLWDDDLLTIDLGVAYRVTERFTVYATVYNVTDDTRTSDADYTYLEEGRRYWLSGRATL